MRFEPDWAYDCLDLEKFRESPDSAAAYEGLAEISRRKGDTNQALYYYQQCLTAAPAGSDVARIVATRMRELQPENKAH